MSHVLPNTTRRHNPFAQRARGYCVPCRYATRRGSRCPTCQADLAWVRGEDTPAKTDDAGWARIAYWTRGQIAEREKKIKPTIAPNGRLKSFKGILKQINRSLRNEREA